MARKIKLGLY